jgi:hypothetical protein
MSSSRTGSMAIPAITDQGEDAIAVAMAISVSFYAEQQHGRGSEVGVPGAIRTHGPQIRNLVLYPAELRGHIQPV